MYRDRLINTPVHSDSARQLQQLLLAYHDFRNYKAEHPLAPQLATLGDWQAERLRCTHQDLYQHRDYHDGLRFLLSDLYAPAGMTRRDDNIDRVFPKMVRWLPDQQLETFAGLVELNLVTQRLDLSLVQALADLGYALPSLQPEQYCEAYRACGLEPQRRRQIELVAEVGRQLDRYVRNRTLGWLLSITRGPADMAGLSDLHSFLHRGYSAFRAMANVERLIDQLVTREAQVMAQILDRHPTPFGISAAAAPAI